MGWDRSEWVEAVGETVSENSWNKLSIVGYGYGRGRDGGQRLKDWTEVGLGKVWDGGRG